MLEKLEDLQEDNYISNILIKIAFTSPASWYLGYESEATGFLGSIDYHKWDQWWRKGWVCDGDQLTLVW